MKVFGSRSVHCGDTGKCSYRGMLIEMAEKAEMSELAEKVTYRHILIESEESEECEESEDMKVCGSNNLQRLQRSQLELPGQAG